MIREVIPTRKFANEIASLIRKNKITNEDYLDFKRDLAEHPKQGDVISGTGGIRKTRLKSASKGKRGGFRVCYLDFENKLVLFLVHIYAKNDQEDLSQEEKRNLRAFTEEIKGGVPWENFTKT